MPDAATVWLWRPGADRGEPGTLALERDALSFTGRRGERFRISRGAIDRARRHRASPVIELRYRRDGEPRVALLFFAEPPQMPDRHGGHPATFGTTRGTRRAEAILRLREENRRLRSLVRAWAEALGS